MNDKKFLISLPDVAGVSEQRIKLALLEMLAAPTSNRAKTKNLFRDRVEVKESTGKE